MLLQPKFRLLRSALLLYPSPTSSYQSQSPPQTRMCRRALAQTRKGRPSADFRQLIPPWRIIEALGVPHTEVELILVNGVSVDFAHRLRQGNRVAVDPKFWTNRGFPTTRRTFLVVDRDAQFLGSARSPLSEAGPRQLSTVCPPLAHSVASKFCGQRPTLPDLSTAPWPAAHINPLLKSLRLETLGMACRNPLPPQTLA